MISLYAPNPSATEDCCLKCRQVYDINQEGLDPLDPNAVKWKHVYVYIYVQVTQVTMLLSNSTIVTAPLALLLYLWPVLPTCGTAARYLQ